MSPSLPARWLALAAATAFMLIALASVSAPSRTVQALTNCDVADMGIDGEEQAFLGLINNYRATAGAPALTITQPLTRAATWLSVDMSQKNYFAHNDLLGRDPFTRMNQCDVPGWDDAGENIVAGQTTAQQAFTVWRNSPEHNANMLSTRFRGIGIARAFRQGSTYGWYWTTTFSAVVDGAAPPPPQAPNAPPPPPQQPDPPAAPPAPAPGCSAVSLASDQPNTVPPNTRITFTANPTCPSTPSLQWWGAYVAPNGSQSWQQITAYNAPRTYTWTAPATPGSYVLGVWAKVNGTSPAGGFDTSAMMNVTVANPAPPPCTAVTLTPPGGTSKVGATVKFTATAACPGTAQYQWWGAIVLADGSQSWQALTQFGAQTTYDWTPTATGTYIFGVWAKNQGSSPPSGYEVSAANQFTVGP